MSAVVVGRDMALKSRDQRRSLLSSPLLVSGGNLLSSFQQTLFIPLGAFASLPLCVAEVTELCLAETGCRQSDQYAWFNADTTHSCGSNRFQVQRPDCSFCSVAILSLWQGREVV